MKLSFYAYLLFLGIICLNCSRIIPLLRYNSNTNCYQASFLSDSLKSNRIHAWKTLRDPNSKEKITGKIHAKTVIDNFNQGREKNVFYEESTNLYRQYSAGQYYYAAIKLLKDKDYKNANYQFLMAINKNPDLLYTSDVAFLKSQCFNKMNEPDSADFEFKRFTDYSESVYPKSFNLQSYNSDSVYSYLMLNKDFFDPDVQRLHFTNKFKGPALRSRRYPGFIIKTYGMPRMNIIFLLEPDRFGSINTGVLVELIMLDRVKGFFQYLQTVRSIGITYQIYRRYDNRLGLTGTIYSRNIYPNLDNKKIDSKNTGFNLTAGYFVFPRLALYLGYDYFQWNRSNPKTKIVDNIKYKLWNENRFTTGMTFFITEQIGLTCQYDNIVNFKIGLYLGGGMLFFY